ncbi:MAG: hypothetical protein Q9M91_03370 [Candidatus Dojkabacteria bacterium]|nr:hypothetical protein [Candidatus Dojkabacteria bacterium]MDQ7020863.1 hypothetical protein [Candidatus Dojkabacteria bacterium]
MQAALTTAGNEAITNGNYKLAEALKIRNSYKIQNRAHYKTAEKYKSIIIGFSKAVEIAGTTVSAREH